MKTITKLILGMLLCSFNFVQAQVELDAVDINTNKTYEEVRYYYFPNMQAYYDTKVGMYLYQENGHWVESEQLDMKSRGYSLKNGQYVMLKDYLGDEPFEMLDEHKKLYPANYSSRPQKPTQGQDTGAMVYQSQPLATVD
ncbi:hypothetical protein [Flavobacterium caeni]|uniref:MORN repeat variant n=1 Tax=Flavobacterium caeni TaxID=490189 RepID=A0A1G5CIS1_9FLAO|nr:hypothetical protein [Flavobacterium caeni]SCY02207.1 hypothetical protein SAMN02927903_00550 [Flavobacterium caeni]